MTNNKVSLLFGDSFFHIIGTDVFTMDKIDVKVIPLGNGFVSLSMEQCHCNEHVFNIEVILSSLINIRLLESYLTTNKNINAVSIVIDERALFKFHSYIDSGIVGKVLFTSTDVKKVIIDNNSIENVLDSIRRTGGVSDGSCLNLYDVSFVISRSICQ